MYRQIFILNEQNNAVVMPREWYGQEIEVIAFPVAGNKLQVKNVPIQSQKKRLQEIQSITKDIYIDLNNFQFNRNTDCETIYSEDMHII